MERQLFDPESMDSMRAALASFRKPGAYEPEKWSVTPYPRGKGMRSRLSPSVSIRDITMRTIEQMPGIVMTTADRHQLLKAIVDTGVPEVITTSTYFGNRGQDEAKADIDVVRNTSPTCKVVYTAANTEQDFDLARAGGYDIVHCNSNYLGEAGALINAAVFDRLWREQDWRDVKFPRTAREAIDRSVRLVGLGKDRGLYMSAGMNLIAYHSDDYIGEFCGAVAAAGADDITFADSSSAMSPEAFGHLIDVAKEAAPNCRIVTHTHDMLGFALANTTAAVMAGAGCCEVSVNGYHLGYSQADLAATAVALEVLYGIPTGMKLERLYDLSRLAVELVGIEVPPFYPVTGPEVFALGWGDPMVDEVFLDPVLHKPIAPSLVGNRFVFTLTPSIGRFGLWRKLDEMGIAATKPQVEAILERVLGRMNEQRRRVTDEEIREFAAQVGAATAVRVGKSA